MKQYLNTFLATATGLIAGAWAWSEIDQFREEKKQHEERMKKWEEKS